MLVLEGLSEQEAQGLTREEFEAAVKGGKRLPGEHGDDEKPAKAAKLVSATAVQKRRVAESESHGYAAASGDVAPKASETSKAPTRRAAQGRRRSD